MLWYTVISPEKSRVEDILENRYLNFSFKNISAITQLSPPSGVILKFLTFPLWGQHYSLPMFTKHLLCERSSLFGTIAEHYVFHLDFCLLKTLIRILFMRVSWALKRGKVQLTIFPFKKHSII